jgi:short/branched chain acyl-CoA dehydrogenase
MGIETEAELGGAGMSFTSALIAIEELAKVDPSVSALVDIHVSIFGFYFVKSLRVVYRAFL